MDETPETEWQWFRRAIRDSLLFPRRFAASLAREHFGLAGALVGLLAGMCFSIATELLLIAGKGLDPLEHVARIVTDAVLLGLRLSIVAALMAAAVCAVSIVLRSRRIGIDQAFTALTFALTPVLIAPVLATVVTVAPGAFTAAAVIAVLLVLRLVYGLVENLRRFVPLAVAITATVVAIASVPLVLGGVRIDHPRGLAGHSDGDVLAHALTDALLGAAHRPDAPNLTGEVGRGDLHLP
jgi:multisubunit Na+/H+ antiporter MnhE subunit